MVVKHGPSGHAVAAATGFCKALSMSRLRSVSEGEAEKHRDTSQSQHRNCGSNDQEEEVEMGGVRSKNGPRTHIYVPRKLLVCRLEAGKRAVGGQKLGWADAVTKDLKRCKIDKDWREVAQNRDEWNAIVETRVSKLDVEAEELEKVRKDECKQRRESKSAEAQAELYCKEVGCSFFAQSKTGLVNHQRQKHRLAAQDLIVCSHCSGQYRQGLNNHVKFCKLNPSKGKLSCWKEQSLHKFPP